MEFLTHPFTLGLVLGLIFALLALYRLAALKFEFSRYKKHLSDKLEIEAEMLRKGKADREALQKENENLRVQIQNFNQLPDRQAARELEVFARAEKKLVMNVPGFVQAWETAKDESLSEIEQEAAGKSLPRKVFSKLFAGGKGQSNLSDEAVKALPGQEAESKES